MNITSCAVLITSTTMYFCNDIITLLANMFLTVLNGVLNYYVSISWCLFEYIILLTFSTLPSRLSPLSISAWEVNNQIGLHVTVDGKVFSVFSSTLDQTGSCIISMSATDKITQWQVLGFQGALLSHFIEPIYVSSIFIGTFCTWNKWNHYF